MKKTMSTTSTKRRGRQGCPVEIIDTVQVRITRYASEADAAVAELGDYNKRGYINMAVSHRGTGTVPHTNGRYIARRLSSI